MAETQTNRTTEVALEAIVNNAIQIPGVKVDRQKFLAESFAKEDVDTQEIIDLGPIEAGCSQEILARIANKLILTRTSTSSVASFAMGLPGGFAMGATIPADTLQFFGMSLRLAQELAYLYGAQDLWQNGEIDNEAVRGQLILYCGVMFGVSGAAAGVRILSSQITKTTLQRLPQKALMKTLWYPIVKQVGKLIGIKVTKNTFAKGVSKAIPVVGGVVSGGLNFASMLPMAKRLAAALDKANFDYTEEEVLIDYEEVQEMSNNSISIENEEKTQEKISVKDRTMKGIKHGINSIFTKGKKASDEDSSTPEQGDDTFSKIEKLVKLRETGAITQEEYEAKKADLLSRI